MIVVWWLSCPVQTIEKQKRVAGIDNGMNSFAQHSRAACQARSTELRCGDEKVSDDCRVKDFP
jgi:hypothetical protein